MLPNAFDIEVKKASIKVKYSCPVCETACKNFAKDRYCHGCGMKLEWSGCINLLKKGVIGTVRDAEDIPYYAGKFNELDSETRKKHIFGPYIKKLFE